MQIGRPGRISFRIYAQGSSGRAWLTHICVDAGELVGHFAYMQRKRLDAKSSDGETMIIIARLAPNKEETPGNVRRLLQYFDASLSDMKELPRNQVAQVSFLGEHFGSVYFYDAEIKDIIVGAGGR